jgi:hypothetical protein
MSTYITNMQLLDTYLTPELEKYFFKKMPEESQEYIRLKICELLKYLSLSHNSFSNIPFNTEIDEMWHLWIIQTVQYQELIGKLSTGSFIHHCSDDYDDGNTDKNSIDEENNIQFSYLVSYVANFGDFTNEAVKFWPLANTLMNIMSLTWNHLIYF